MSNELGTPIIILLDYTYLTIISTKCTKWNSKNEFGDKPCMITHLFYLGIDRYFSLNKLTEIEICS